MRAFLMCAVLAVAGLTVATTSARADHWYHGYYGRPAVVVVRPAPVVIAPAPVVIAPAPIVAAPVVVAPVYAPAPVVVGPVVRPLVSLRIGIR